MYDSIYKQLGIIESAYERVSRLEGELECVFRRIEGIESLNQAKVLAAFQKNRVAAQHFNPTTGYGYDDVGRECLDRVFADALGTEAAIVSPQLVSGTHAIFCVLAGILRAGDTMLAISGRPYDTLLEAIGIEGEAEGSLRDFNIKYEQLDLLSDGKFDLNAIESAVKGLKPRLVHVQRSRGYAWREAIAPADMEPVFKLIKQLSPETVIVVDNCYGEFTLASEPTDHGADIIVGSLIKNPGGGLAPTGGYFAGKRETVDRIANRLTVPGIGREAGSYFASYLPFFQGVFLAPHIVAQSLKTSVLFSKMFEELKLSTMPSSSAVRSDIVQALRFSNKEQLIGFCQCIQSVSPVDSFALPEPYAMPGYSNEVIMAAGAFVQGSSIELSADAPICEPYTAYLQGGLTYSHGRIAAMRVLSVLEKSESGGVVL
ncbi:MAG: methionine gamma-lyase family protein [Clostridia bacterium]|nr:methionine gamma-lyase family protein [Clostridia bacterium]